VAVVILHVHTFTPVSKVWLSLC